MPQVFISYKGEEESWAARLADTLESFGIDVWRDHGVSKGIRISEQWRPELQAAIQRSADMIVMWSQKLRGDATSVAPPLPDSDFLWWKAQLAIKQSAVERATRFLSKREFWPQGVLSQSALFMVAGALVSTLLGSLYLARLEK